MSKSVFSQLRESRELLDRKLAQIDQWQHSVRGARRRCESALDREEARLHEEIRTLARRERLAFEEKEHEVVVGLGVLRSNCDAASEQLAEMMER